MYLLVFDNCHFVKMRFTLHNSQNSHCIELTSFIAQGTFITETSNMEKKFNLYTASEVRTDYQHQQAAAAPFFQGIPTCRLLSYYRDTYVPTYLLLKTNV